MFNDKLVIPIYKNTIYQSKLKLLVIFVTILVCKQHTLFQTDSAHAQFIIQRRSYLDWLELEYPRHKLLATTFPPKYFVKTTFRCFLAVLVDFLLTSVRKKIRFKKSDKIVDTVTLISAVFCIYHILIMKPVLSLDQHGISPWKYSKRWTTWLSGVGVSFRILFHEKQKPDYCFFTHTCS
jgi:hypothetical protein